MAIGNKAWLQAIRLRTLPLAIASIGMGSFLAARQVVFSWAIFGLAMLTALLLQILSNLANDYGDTLHGADSSGRVGPQRAVQAGLISRSAMKKAIGITAALTFLSGIGLLLVAFDNWTDFLWFLVFGVAALLAAVLYTLGKKPYGYSGLGDIFVFVFFGLLGVSGSAYLFMKTFDPEILLPAASVGFLTTAVLNVNNIRDRLSDRAAGKMTLAVRWGKQGATIYHSCLIVGAYIAAAGYVLMNRAFWPQWVFLILLPAFGLHVRALSKREGAALDPLLRQMAVLTVLFVGLFGVGQLII